MEIISTCIQSLHQLRIFLSGVERSAYLLSQPQLSGSSIGQHTRHMIEFYQCLLQQYRAGTVNYDLRPRERSLESTPEDAILAVDRLCACLQEIRGDRDLILIHEDTRGIRHSSPSSLSRELIYVLEHTVHHMAILRIAMHILHTGQEVPDSFGVAASTLRYKQMQEG